MLKNQIRIIKLLAVTAVSTFVIGCSGVHTQESSGQYLDSTVITTKVKAKLLTNKSIKSLPITVKTYKNTVQLSGFVDNNYQKKKAVDIAKSVEGVQEVEDALVIKTH